MKLHTPKSFPVVLANIANANEAVLKAGEAGIRKGLEFAQKTAQREYLRGPRPERLGEVTTRLRQSISYDVQRTGKGVVGRIGSNVKYARFHEFGLIGTVNVRAHARHVQAKLETGTKRGARYLRDRSGNLIGIKRESAEQAKRRGAVVDVQKVKAHTRRLNYKGRPFIRPSLEKAQRVIRDSILAALEGIKP